MANWKAELFAGILSKASSGVDLPQFTKEAFNR
jgi:hypothetical protein